MRFKKGVLLLVIVTLILCSCSTDSLNNLIYKTTSDDYGDTGGLSLPIDVNNTKIDIMLVSQVEDLSDKIVIKELSKRTGININIIPVNESQINQETKKFMGTNELPDILCNSITFEEINALGIKGTFTPVNKYLNELPNFKRVFTETDEFSSIFSKYTASDGNLYVFPGYETERRIDNVMLYRKDIFDKHNIKMWENTEEFYETLKKLKKIYPESVPFTVKSKNKFFDELSVSFGIDFPGVYYDNRRNVWIYSSIDDKCKEMLDFVRKLYQEDLIKPDFLTSDEISWETELLSDGKSFVTLDSINYADILCESIKDKNPKFDLRYANPVGNDGKVRAVSTTFADTCVTNNDNKLISLKLLDYLLSPSGVSLMSLGMKNETYIFDSDDKVKYLGFTFDTKASTKTLEEKYGLFVKGLSLSYDRKSAIYNYSEREQDAISKTIGENKLYYGNPEVKLSKEEKEIIKNIETELINKAYAFAAEYVFASNMGDDAFKAWRDYAYEHGVEKILEIYNSK